MSEFSKKRTSVESENYIKLLLSIAEDIRVVFIIIAQHLRLMREAKNAPSSKKLKISKRDIVLQLRHGGHTDWVFTRLNRNWRIYLLNIRTGKRTTI